MVRQVRFLVTVEELPRRGHEVARPSPAEGSHKARTASAVASPLARARPRTRHEGSEVAHRRHDPALVRGWPDPIHIRVPKLHGFKNSSGSSTRS